MSERLTRAQRQTLGQLAHIRTLPDQQILGTRRLAELALSDFFAYDRMHSILSRLEKRGLVERVPKPQSDMNALWRITDRGRAALR